MTKKVVIVNTKCTPEEQEQDRDALQKAHERAMKNEVTWEIFGGVITLPNGHKYQVMNEMEEKN